MIKGHVMTVLLCSNCFIDEGLRIDAARLGHLTDEVCPNCKSLSGSKLDNELLESLAYRFFVRGTVQRLDYGASPLVQFNNAQYGEGKISVSSWLEKDISLISEALKIGFFNYGPRLWMLGEVYPLKELQDDNTRDIVITRILNEYPAKLLAENQVFYRLRINPSNPSDFLQYDSAPDEYCGKNRLDSAENPVCYVSQDLEVCIHECRVTVEDEIFVATLEPVRQLKLLDLTELLEEEVTEFESLDMAVHMLFSAGKHAYPITRQIAQAARHAGFDGLIYPSYFSHVRIGATPFATAYGISVRRFPSYKEHAKSNIIPNIGLFGRPVAENAVRVKCINRMVLSRIIYDAHFGPVSVD